MLASTLMVGRRRNCEVDLMGTSPAALESTNITAHALPRTVMLAVAHTLYQPL